MIGRTRKELHRRLERQAREFDQVRAELAVAMDELENVRRDIGRVLREYGYPVRSGAGAEPQIGARGAPSLAMGAELVDQVAAAPPGASQPRPAAPPSPALPGGPGTPPARPLPCPAQLAEACRRCGAAATLSALRPAPGVELWNCDRCGCTTVVKHRGGAS